VADSNRDEIQKLLEDMRNLGLRAHAMHDQQTRMPPGEGSSIPGLVCSVLASLITVLNKGPGPALRLAEACKHAARNY
jgi:hypothetical protein